MNVKYILHDTQINKIFCNNERIELIFDKGVYILNEQGNDAELSGPCRLVIHIKYLDLNKMYEFVTVIKHWAFKEKEIEYEDFLKLIEKSSFDIDIDYYSFFARAILLTGNCGTNTISLRITDIDKVEYIFEK